jgi:hypothetical protein
MRSRTGSIATRESDSDRSGRRDPEDGRRDPAGHVGLTRGGDDRVANRAAEWSLRIE